MNKTCSDGSREIEELLQNKFTSIIRTGYANFKGTHMPASFAKYQAEIEKLEVRQDDVWLASFPKSGTTWAQEMVWLIANNLDYERAKIPQPTRFPFLELSGLADFTPFKEKNASAPFGNTVEIVRDFQGRRFIKTHLPWELLPLQIQKKTKTPKVIHVMRNPKDACVSYFHHAVLLEGFRGNVEEFAKLFLAGRVNDAPYWNNILGYWNRRHDSNILIVKYEDMKRDLRSVIRQVAEFLDERLTEEEVEKLVHHLSFEQMKNNRAVNFEPMVEVIESLNCYERNRPVGKFMRTGNVGTYKKELSQDTTRQLDEWIERNIANTGITF